MNQSPRHILTYRESRYNLIKISLLFFTERTVKYFFYIYKCQIFTNQTKLLKLILVKNFVFLFLFSKLACCSYKSIVQSYGSNNRDTERKSILSMQQLKDLRFLSRCLYKITLSLMSLECKYFYL